MLSLKGNSPEKTGGSRAERVGIRKRKWSLYHGAEVKAREDSS